MRVPSWIAAILSTITFASAVAVAMSGAPTHVRGILVNVTVPSHERLGNYARLGCGYDMMGGEALYTLKWYKDLHEFFRYSPSERFEKRKEIRKLPGVTVVEESFPAHLLAGERSDGFVQTYITLRSVDLNSTGIFRCEITADGPPFATMFAEQNMVVVAIPDGPPEISGDKPFYKIGDEVKLDCVYGNAKPMPALTWYINGMKAENSLLTDHLPKADANKRETAGLELKFRLTKDHIITPVSSSSPSPPGVANIGDRQQLYSASQAGVNQPQTLQEKTFGDYWSASSSLITSLFSSGSSSPTSSSAWTRLQETAMRSNNVPHYQYGTDDSINYGHRSHYERHNNNNRRMYNTRDRPYANVTCSASISNVHYINATKQLRTLTKSPADLEQDHGKHQSGSSSSLNHISSNYVAHSSASISRQFQALGISTVFWAANVCLVHEFLVSFQQMSLH